ncbi:MAG TPA: glycosyltransferase family 39 protein [Pyrinomonadaceae bacterium]|nr:glycosyltransferase family 39 protein [Pyrinomonadaceae bacterium]
MNILIIVLVVGIFGGVIFIRPEEGPGALAVCVLVSAPTIVILARSPEQRTFLMRLFLIAVMIRVLLALVIFVGHFEEFFGGDANTYDIFGQSLVQSWHGDAYHTGKFLGFTQSGASAWGMLYMVAAVYEVIGRNMFAIQLINAAIGGTTAIVVYHVAQILFSNIRVSKLAALLVAFFPSLILWSSQALKDGMIILALALAILATLRLMEKITVGFVIVLIGSLLALFSFRFYIFYMMTAAVMGSFFLGAKAFSAQGFMQRFVAVAGIGLAFTWFGVLQGATVQFEKYANLKQMQASREDLASAGSGFMKDVDVQTTEGALTVIPIGLLYLMFAPFPWDFATLRQTITLPEMIVWWMAFPLLVLGLWFAVKHRLRQVSPIIIFTTMLTLAYSLFQGNVGTAYRQRSQLLVFYFIFVAVGAILLKERAEDRRRQSVLAKQELAELQAARVLARRNTAMGSS